MTQDLVVIEFCGEPIALLRSEFEAARARGKELITGCAVTASTVTTEPLITAGELAAQLGVPPTWIETKARQGLIPHAHLGRRRRFKRSEVERAVQALQRGHHG